MIDTQANNKPQTALLYALLLLNAVVICVGIDVIYHGGWPNHVVESPILCEKCLTSTVGSSRNEQIKATKSATSNWNYWLALGAGVVVIGLLIYYSDSYLPCSSSELIRHVNDCNNALETARKALTELNETVSASMDTARECAAIWNQLMKWLQHPMV